MSDQNSQKCNTGKVLQKKSATRVRKSAKYEHETQFSSVHLILNWVFAKESEILLPCFPLL